MERTWLIQRLERPRTGTGPLAKLGNPFAFGGGLKNGSIADEAMDLLRSVFAFDYMGSAEFEFGAVPKSLARIYDGKADYELFKMAVPLALVKSNYKRKFGDKKLIASYPPKPVGERAVYVYCRKVDADDVKKVIIELAQDKLRLKEGSNFDIALDPVEKWDNRTCGWLELNNHFFFFADKEMADATVKLFQG